MGRIVYAFPATGKTYLCRKNGNCIELSSEKYHWLDIDMKEKNKGHYNILNLEWPNNYLEAIKKAQKEYNFVFITHSGSELCKKNNIHYDLIYPTKECKKEYIERMQKRDNNKDFIKNMTDNFDAYISELDEDDYPDEKIKLKPGEYLETGIHELEQLIKTPLLDSFSSKDYLININKTPNIYQKDTKLILNDKGVKYALITFNSKYIESIVNSGLGKEVGRFYSGSDYKKIILLDNFIITSSFLGGPNASGLMEELSYYGIKYFLAVGTACKIKDIDCDCLLVDKAIRDEGTSLHYCEESLYAYTDRKMNKEIIDILNDMKIRVNNGVTWTIDAYYRENIERLNKRIKQGAVCIDMESSIWCSVAKELELLFSQLLFFTDVYQNGVWKKGKKNSEINNSISNIGVEISKRLVKKIGGI